MAGPVDTSFPKRLGRMYELIPFEVIETAFMAARTRIEYQYFHSRTSLRYRTQGITPLPLRDLVRVFAIELDKLAMVLQDASIMTQQGIHLHRDPLVLCRVGRQANSLHDQVITIGPVTHLHIKRCGGRPFFSVPIDVETLNIGASKEQLPD